MLIIVRSQFDGRLVLAYALGLIVRLGDVITIRLRFQVQRLKKIFWKITGMLF